MLDRFSPGVITESYMRSFPGKMLTLPGISDMANSY